MPLNPLLPTLLAGLSSGLIFALSSAFSTAGALLIYASLFPLLLLGLSFGTKRAALACITGCIAALTLCPPADSLFYPLLVALPVLVFLHRALQWRESVTTGDVNGRGHNAREWYPMLTILAVLAVLAAGIYMSLAMVASRMEPGGLQGAALRELAEDTGGDRDVAANVKLLLGDWLFLLLAGTGWLWLVSLYFCALVANHILARAKRALRPAFILAPTGLPGWLLGLLSISALLALAGRGNDRLNGETVFLILLLPYFFAGMARIHLASQSWPGRAYLLTLVYFLLMFPPWMAFIAVITGLYGQLAEMLDKRLRMR